MPIAKKRRFPPGQARQMFNNGNNERGTHHIPTRHKKAAINKRINNALGGLSTTIFWPLVVIPLVSGAGNQRKAGIKAGNQGSECKPLLPIQPVTHDRHGSGTNPAIPKLIPAKWNTQFAPVVMANQPVQESNQCRTACLLHSTIRRCSVKLPTP